MRPGSLVTLRELLPAAEAGGYAVGSFAPRYLALIEPVLAVAERLRSPIIVQISSKELRWFACSAADFAAEFFGACERQQVSVPVVLHLDHTHELPVIQQAIEAGFTSVMIDCSDRSLGENITCSAEVSAYAHPRGVSVEGELGRIFSADTMETESDEELFTVPEEAAQYVRDSQIDALAVSVGTAHGVYSVRQPRVDLPRIRAIRRLTPVPLVLHGGSGVPAELMRAAISLPDGGISKVNIATDLELAFLAALGRRERSSNAEVAALPPAQLAAAQLAVQQVVIEKIEQYLLSSGRA